MHVHFVTKAASEHIKDLKFECDERCKDINYCGSDVHNYYKAGWPFVMIYRAKPLCNKPM